MTLLELHIKFERCQWQPIVTAYHYHNNKVLDESNCSHRKTRRWILLLMKQVATRKAGNAETCVWTNKVKYWAKPQTKKNNTGADFIPLNHPWRTNHEAQVNISKSFEKDILCMVDVAKVQRYWKFHLMWIKWDSNLVPNVDCTQE